MNEENKNTVNQEQNSIDFRKIFKDMRKYRKRYILVMVITFVVVAFFSLSLPNYYKCTVKLSPEMSSSRSSAGLAAMASSFGVSLSNNGTEALFPTLYPELVNSKDFKISLFHVPVTIEGKKEGEMSRTMSYYDYLENEQRSPWWGKVIAAPFKLLGKLLSPKGAEENADTLDSFRLTMKQAHIVEVIDKKVECEIDKMTMVITIKVTDQDPVICATMADSVKCRLQEFITDYRTSKARVDLEYSKMICQEAKARYENARKEYSRYVDANNNVILQTVRQKQIDLENELQIQYNAYMQVANQVVAAEAKVQEETPAFTTLQSATVPVKKAGPSRSKICIVFVFLAFLVVTARVLYKEDDFKMFF